MEGHILHAQQTNKQTTRGTTEYSRCTAAASRTRGGPRATVSRLFITLTCAALLWPGQPALAQFSQYGSKLVGSGAFMGPEQGFSVALSGRGTTAIVGGPFDGNSTTAFGAAWVWSLSAGEWLQQQKLAGPFLSDELGYSVGLMPDGNTALVGLPAAADGDGKARVYTRSGTSWTLQAEVSGDPGSSFGWSVAVSAGGTTIIGEPSYNSGAGAVLINDSLRLVGTGAVGNASQGFSVAISADGNTALVGGPEDASCVGTVCIGCVGSVCTGATWVFTRSGGSWIQEAKLVATDFLGQASQGYSVALSADGNTAIVGGPHDNNNAGAAWVWTRNGTSWSEVTKLVGNDAVGSAAQGWSVALSAAGNTAIIGGPYDNGEIGAAWVFTGSGGVWVQQGPKLVGSGVSGPIALQGTSVALSGDGKPPSSAALMTTTLLTGTPPARRGSSSRR
jgi:FG-GAP repeat